jgi:predicted ester cyclase
MARTDFTQDATSVATAMLDKFNTRDFAGMIDDGGGAVDYTEVGTGRHITDADEMVATLQAWVTAFPDVRGRLLSAMRDGDRLCLEINWEGTHDGPLATPSGTMPATGNRTSTRAAQLVTIRDGRIVDTVHYLDIMTMMAQLSGTPAARTEQRTHAPA